MIIYEPLHLIKSTVAFTPEAAHRAEAALAESDPHYPGSLNRVFTDFGLFVAPNAAGDTQIMSGTLRWNRDFLKVIELLSEHPHSIEPRKPAQLMFLRDDGAQFLIEFQDAGVVLFAATEPRWHYVTDWSNL